MNYLLLGGAACVAALLLLGWGMSSGDTVPLHVELKLTDPDYQGLSGVPIRLVFGVGDWRGPDAGSRIVTAQDGTVQFDTEAVIDRRWSSSNIGFTPFSMPFRADHLLIAA